MLFPQSTGLGGRDFQFHPPLFQLKWFYLAQVKDVLNNQCTVYLCIYLFISVHAGTIFLSVWQKQLSSCFLSHQL